MKISNHNPTWTNSTKRLEENCESQETFGKWFQQKSQKLYDVQKFEHCTKFFGNNLTHEKNFVSKVSIMYVIKYSKSHKDHWPLTKL